MGQNLSDSEIRDILTRYQKIAVVGLSPVPARPSFGVTRYLIKEGYEIFGVRPASPPEILGRPCVESLSQLKDDIEIIDVFRNSDAIPGLVDEIEAFMNSKPDGAKPKVLWLQEGVTNKEAEKKARALGLAVISDRCILKEHARLC